MTAHFPVIVVGGGHAGLSMSARLVTAGIEHVVLERDCVVSAWRRQRWDSFCLVTPNWQCLLPGFPYPGEDPDGFMVKDQIVDYLLAFARSFDPPVREGVEVRRVAPDGDRFFVATSHGDYTADQVVIAIGAYHFPSTPAYAAELPSSVLQLHSSEYKNPGSLPPGDVLVVGSGQSGCQIVEDLHLAGRAVHLSVGSAPRSPRFYRGKDAVWWLDQMGHYRTSIDAHEDPEVTRAKTNHYLTGRDGGREIDLRRFALEGVRLYGSLSGAAGPVLSFRDNLRACLDEADAVYCGIQRLIDGYIAQQGIAAPVEAPYTPCWAPPAAPVTALDVERAGITSIIWSTGFGFDFSFIEAPVFDDRGYPRYRRGVTETPGLYFVGLPWLHTWGSGRLSGVAEDTAHLLEHIAARRAHAGEPSRAVLREMEPPARTIARDGSM